jgi:hypothetical protein
MRRATSPASPAVIPIASSHHQQRLVQLYAGRCLGVIDRRQPLLVRRRHHPASEAGVTLVYSAATSRWFLLTDAFMWKSVTDLPESLTLSGVISPTQITSNQNDYNPGSLSVASVLRLSSDASRNITGILAGASGRILKIVNVGSNRDRAEKRRQRIERGQSLRHQRRHYACVEKLDLALVRLHRQPLEDAGQHGRRRGRRRRRDGGEACQLGARRRSRW